MNTHSENNPLDEEQILQDLDKAIMARDLPKMKQLIETFEQAYKDRSAHATEVVRDNKGNEYKMLRQ